MAGASLDAAAGAALAPVAQKRKKGFLGLFGRKKKAGKRANVWDSPLLLVGGGTLLLLLIIGGAVYLSLHRETGDRMLEPAHEDYRNGSYTQAIYKYDQFLESFPEHRGASLARVRRGLARLRQSAEGTRDWPKTLEVAKEVLEEIKTETAFKEADDELSSLLPTIAQGLADQARKTPDPALVQQAKETLALVNTLPPSLRPKMKLEKIQASLALTERELARDTELQKAIAAMHGALKEGNAAEAYRVRSALLKQYHDLVANPQLDAAVLEISKVQQATVKKVAQKQAPQTTDPPTPVTAAVTLARPAVAETAVGVQGRVVFALAGGAVYGLDGASGNVLWRRPVGSRSNGRSPRFLPTPISRAAKSDVLLADTVRNEIARLETAAPPKLRWRLPLGQPLDAHPVVANDQVLAVTYGDQGSRLWKIDAESGASAGYVQLPQPVRVTPAVDSRRDNVYLVAEHSNLYVLSLADGHCKEVVYLGHQLGSISTRPITVGHFLLLADNDKLESSTLRVFSVETEGEGPSVRPLQQIKLPGHVDTPPLVADRRLALVTDSGAICVFEVSGTNAEKPLNKVAEHPAQKRKDLVRFPLLESSQFWVAGNQLSKYDIVAARGRLMSKAILNPDEGAVFVQPLVAAGHTLFHARYEVGLPGVLVSAVEMDGGKRLWQTHLASPLAVGPTVDPQSGAVTAVTAAGALFRVDAQAIKPIEEQSVVNRPLAAVDTSKLRRPLGAVVRLPDGLVAMAAAQGAEQVFVFDPGQAEKEKRVLSLALPGPLSCAPVGFAGGLLAPCTSGQVFVLDPRTGGKQIEPFQPPLGPGVQLHWRDPALVGDKGFVIADGDRKLYHVGIVDKPARHLAAFASAEVPEPIVSPVAVIGKVAYAVDEAGTLAAFTLPEALPASPPRPLPELARAEVARLSGRCVWGPRTVGSRVLLATDDGQLLLLDAQQKVLARLALPYGPLAGTPLEIDGSYVLASASGVVWRVKPAAGDAPPEDLGKVDTGRPLGSGPVLREGHLLLAGRDGNLLEVAMPEPAKSDP